MAETGICRLSGHKGVITKLVFMKEHNIIISSSKDTFVKFWDLDTEHNFKTIVGHKSEVSYLIMFLLFIFIDDCNIDSILIQVWSFVLMNDDRYLITGCNDMELRVWKITFIDNKNVELDAAIGTSDINEENEESVDTDMVCIYTCIYYTEFM